MLTLTLWPGKPLWPLGPGGALSCISSCWEKNTHTLKLVFIFEAQFRHRTSHEPNLIQQAGFFYLGRPKLELGSAHEKFGVWTGPYCKLTGNLNGSQRTLPPQRKVGQNGHVINRSILYNLIDPFKNSIDFGTGEKQRNWTVVLVFIIIVVVMIMITIMIVIIMIIIIIIIITITITITITIIIYIYNYNYNYNYIYIIIIIIL